MRAFLRDHPGWDGLALCGALILPIVAILLVTPRLGVLAIPRGAGVRRDGRLALLRASRTRIVIDTIGAT